MGKRQQEPDDDLVVPMPLGQKPVTQSDLTYPDERALRGAAQYLRVAEERAGQLRTALEMAANAAAGDVATAGQVPRVQELHRDAHTIEQRIARMLRP